MNFGLILTVVGTLVGLISLWGYLMDKINLKKGLRLDSDGCISLANQNIRNLKISLVYKDVVTHNNIILFKGILSNESKKDIGRSDLVTPLQILFGEGRILEAYIKKAPDSHCQCNILNDKCGICIIWDLLKSQETINFEVLIEFDDFNSAYEKQLFKSITFDYRIKNINKVSKLTKAEEDRRENAILLGCIFLGLALWAGWGIYRNCNPFSLKSIDLAPTVSQMYINETDSSTVSIKLSLSNYQVDKFEQASSLEDINATYKLISNQFISDSTWVIIEQIFIVVAFIICSVLTYKLFKSVFKST